MIDLRVVKAGGASWAAEVNRAAFLLTRVYWKSTAEIAVSIKKKKKKKHHSGSSFIKISRPYSKDILSVPVPSPSVKTHL